MKRLLLTVMILFTFVSTSFAQENYTIDGTSYSLNKEVEGTLTLLWNTIDGEYRYFTKKGMDIQELKNTKSENGYEEEYKNVLEEQTEGANMPIDNVKLTLPSLKKFFNEYNSNVDSNYTYETPSIKLKTRLGAFLGGSNNVYFLNPENTFLPSAGIEFEIVDDVKLLRHSLALRLKQLFSSSKYDFSSTQVSLNYRFKFVKSQAVDIYANVKMVSYTHIKRDITFTNEAGQQETVRGNGGEFQVPASFGLGADIPMGNGFIIVSYNDIFGLNIESNNEFPVDFSLGYKFNL